MSLSLPCMAPWNGAVIHFSGIVYPCDQMAASTRQDAMKLGDLQHQSLPQIMNGAAATTLRKRLMEGDIKGLLCETCDKIGSCNLYGDPAFGKAVLHRGPQNQQSTQALPLQRLELGLTDLCNMSCVMCSLSRGEASPKGLRQKGMMSMEIVKKALDGLAELRSSQRPLVLLHWVGEPLIHPHIAEILQWVDQLDVNLHLVTNGLALTEQLTTLLLACRGQHTINFSLNAFDSTVFQQVNASSQRQPVYDNIDRFLQLRGTHFSSWNVIVSSVVLRENMADIPRFTRYWQKKFQQLGRPADLVLNGKGQHGPHQIMLLREIDRPESANAFRSVLAELQIQDPAWPWQDWQDIDRWRLGQADAEEAWRAFCRASVQRSDMALTLLRFGHWQAEQLTTLVHTCQKTGKQWTEVLQKWAFDEQPVFAEETIKLLLHCLTEPINCLLATLFLPQHAFLLLQKSFGKGHLSRQETAMLATILSWNMELVDQLPSTLPQLSDCGDASLTIIELATRRPDVLHLMNTPKPWQWKALASWIYRLDRPGFQVIVDVEKSSTADVFEIFVRSAQPEHLTKSIEQGCSLLQEAEPWLIRAFRRRWLFAGGKHCNITPQVSVPRHIATEHCWERVLLQVSLGDLSVLSSMVDFLLSDASIAGHYWQDLTESLVLPGHIERITSSGKQQLQRLQVCFQGSHVEPTMLLSLAVLLQQLAIPVPWQQIEERLLPFKLPTWQEEQRQELQQIFTL